MDHVSELLLKYVKVVNHIVVCAGLFLMNSVFHLLSQYFNYSIHPFRMLMEQIFFVIWSYIHDIQHCSRLATQTIVDTQTATETLMADIIEGE